MKFGLVTDSVADIPEEIVKKFNIKVIPTLVIIDGKEYLDGIDMSREDYYDQLPDINPPPTTAAGSPRMYEKAYDELIDQGVDHILSIHTAKQLSGIFNAASLAAKKYPDQITMMDSGQLTLGIGYQVMAAAEAIAAGKNLDEIKEDIEDTRNRLQVIALMNTLEQLRRSGRVSWLKAGVGSLLRIKLFLEAKDGELNRVNEARTRKKSILQLKEMLVDLGPLQRLAVLHVNALDEAQAIADEFAQQSKEKPWVVNITPSIGTNVGPKAIGYAALRVK